MEVKTLAFQHHFVLATELLKIHLYLNQTCCAFSIITILFSKSSKDKITHTSVA